MTSSLGCGGSPHVAVSNTRSWRFIRVVGHGGDHTKAVGYDGDDSVHSGDELK